jgi:hypothetical protein
MSRFLLFIEHAFGGEGGVGAFPGYLILFLDADILVKFLCVKVTFS